MLFTYEYIIRDEGREGVRHNEYIMRLQALHTNYFRRQSGGITTATSTWFGPSCFSLISSARW